MTKVIPICFFLVICIKPEGIADQPDEATRIVQRAVTAAGGKEKLAQLLKRRVKTRGTGFDADEKASVNFTFESWLDAPSRCKQIIRLESEGVVLVRTRVLNGQSGWERVDNKTRRLGNDVVSAFQHGQYQAHVLLFFPLLEEKQFTLTVLKECKIGESDALAIRVSSKGKEDISLFFDKKNWLILKMSVRATDPAFKKALHEEYYENHRQIAGVKWPGTVKIFHNGKKYLESELVALEPLEHADPKWFAEP
jgi:hypothetical protein